MKKILVVGIAVMLCAACANKKNKNSGYYGNVKQVTICNYNASEKFGEIATGKLKNKVISKYNTNGEILERDVYYSSGKLKSKAVYTYDNDGFLTQDVEYNSSGGVHQKTTYLNNSKGQKIEAIEYNSKGKQTSKTVFRYDDDNLTILEIIQYKQDEKIDTRILYEQSKDATRVDCMIYNGNDEYMAKLSYLKDSDDNLLEQIEKLEGMDVGKRTVYLYDENNKRIERVVYDIAEKLQSKTKYEHVEVDEIGNTLKRVEYSVEGEVAKPSEITQWEIEYWD